MSRLWYRERNMRKTSIWLAAVLAMLLLTAGCGQPYEFQGTAFPEPLATPQFTLINETGEPLRLGDLQGKVVLLFFGYTTCPDFCPTTLAEARTVLEGLGSKADEVVFLFVTVDPERDTPEKLAAYTNAFHPNIFGLTGDPADLEAVYRDFRVRVEREDLPDSALGYLMGHTTRMYLVDQQGNLRLSYSYGTPPETILQDVKHLLKS